MPCSICGFKLYLSSYEGHKKPLNLMTWLYFIIQQEYLGDFYRSFEYFLEVLTLLKNGNFYSYDMEKKDLRNFLKHIVKIVTMLKILLNTSTNLK